MALLQNFTQTKLFLIVLILVAKIGMVLFENFIMDLEFMTQGMELGGVLLKDTVRFAIKWVRKLWA